MNCPNFRHIPDFEPRIAAALAEVDILKPERMEPFVESLELFPDLPSK
jgi:hypothetical protein